MRNFNKEWGQVSRVILILAGIVLLVAIIVFIAIAIASSRRSTNETPKETTTESTELPKPVYEATVGSIKFTLQESKDLGTILKATTTYQNDLITTDRFVRVIIAAQNKGKNDTEQFVWELGNIIDSAGRNFIPITNKAFYFLPQPDMCGTILKPEFTPVSCVRLYEVSKASTGLKVVVISKSPKQEKALLDLNFVY